MANGRRIKKNLPPHPPAHPGVRGVGDKDRPATGGSVVVLVIIVHIRPQVLITGRVPEVIFNRPQVTEGVVLQVTFTPPLSVPAPFTVPVKGVTAAVRRQASFTFTHPLSPHLRDSVEKSKIQSTFWE
jgi:hypothetical protein